LNLRFIRLPHYLWSLAMTASGRSVGLFFGSFNPVHNGHMMLANYFACFTRLEEVWMVLSPQNPLKKKEQLLPFHQRLHMLQAACEDENFIRPSDVESRLSLPSYTTHTLVHLAEKFPSHTFSLIMGSDNLTTLPQWKNYEFILANYRIMVYPRPGFTHTDHPLFSHPQVEYFTEAPLIEISASFIRNAVKQGKNIRYFMPHKAFEYMDRMNFYKSRPGTPK